MTPLAALSDGMFVALLEAAPDAMVCIGPDGRVVLVNAQAERLFGYQRAELIGQPVEILVPDTARAVHPGRRAGYVADPRHRPMGAGMPLAGRRRDASTFPAEISLSAIDTDEGVLVTAAIRDVTAQLRVTDLGVLSRIWTASSIRFPMTCVPRCGRSAVTAGPCWKTTGGFSARKAAVMPSGSSPPVSR